MKFSTPTHLERLEALIGELETALTTAREDIAKSFPNTDPYLVRDTSGRYVLLEALNSLVQAKASYVLAHAQQPRTIGRHLSQQYLARERSTPGGEESREGEGNL